MSRQVIRLLDEARKRRACEIISTADNNKVVEIKDYKANRSASQLSLYWMWCTVIGNELGYTKDEVHMNNKEKHLTKIMIRDDPDYAEMWKALKTLYLEGLQDQALFLKRRVVDMTSTTKLNVTQFAEYLTDIERHAGSLGITLPKPEDYWLAMGTPDDAA